MGEVYHSSYKGPPSEGSSETSSQSESLIFVAFQLAQVCAMDSPKRQKLRRALKAEGDLKSKTKEN